MPSRDLPQGLDLKARRRRRAGAGLSQRARRRAQGRRLHATASGRLTLHLAREFGFCYGVDRAVDYAYQTRRRFPDQPRLPDRARSSTTRTSTRSCARSGIRFLDDPGESLDALGAGRRRHPAGVRRHDRRSWRGFDRQGCTLVDTTCGSVLNVWKNVRRYARGRLHVRHPRQGPARGNPGHGVAGAQAARRPVPRRARPRRGRRRLRLHPARRRPRGVPGAVRRGGLAGLRPRPRPGSVSASPTRRRC